MTPSTWIALSAGTFAMFVLISLSMYKYKTKIWKALPVAVLLTIVGTVGTYILYFVEKSLFGARSYYGAVFLVPLVFWYVAKLLRIQYSDLLDFCAPAECVMLVIMKYQCLIDGCCGGRLLYTRVDGSGVFFPCQIVELVNAFVLMGILMIMIYKPRFRGNVYGWYLILYGSTRFVLNWFRADLDPWIMGLPDSNVWSLLAIFIGILWITGYKLAIIKRNKTETQSEDNS